MEHEEDAGSVEMVNGYPLRRVRRHIDSWVYRHWNHLLPQRHPIEWDRFSVAMPEDLHDALRQLASELGTSMGSTVRYIVKKQSIHAGVQPDDLPLGTLDDMLEFSGIDVEEDDG